MDNFVIKKGQSLEEILSKFSKKELDVALNLLEKKAAGAKTKKEIKNKEITYTNKCLTCNNEWEGIATLSYFEKPFAVGKFTLKHKFCKNCRTYLQDKSKEDLIGLLCQELQK